MPESYQSFVRRTHHYHEIRTTPQGAELSVLFSREAQGAVIATSQGRAVFTAESPGDTYDQPAVRAQVEAYFRALVPQPLEEVKPKPAVAAVKPPVVAPPPPVKTVEAKPTNVVPLRPAPAPVDISVPCGPKCGADCPGREPAAQAPVAAPIRVVVPPPAPAAPLFIDERRLRALVQDSRGSLLEFAAGLRHTGNAFAPFGKSLEQVVLGLYGNEDGIIIARDDEWNAALDSRAETPEDGAELISEIVAIEKKVDLYSKETEALLDAIFTFGEDAATTEDLIEAATGADEITDGEKLAAVTAGYDLLLEQLYTLPSQWQERIGYVEDGKDPDDEIAEKAKVEGQRLLVNAIRNNVSDGVAALKLINDWVPKVFRGPKTPEEAAERVREKLELDANTAKVAAKEAAKAAKAANPPAEKKPRKPRAPKGAK